MFGTRIGGASTVLKAPAKASICFTKGVPSIFSEISASQVQVVESLNYNANNYNNCHTNNVLHRAETGADLNVYAFAEYSDDCEEDDFVENKIGCHLSVCPQRTMLADKNYRTNLSIMEAEATEAY